MHFFFLSVTLLKVIQSMRRTCYWSCGRRFWSLIFSPPGSFYPGYVRLFGYTQRSPGLEVTNFVLVWRIKREISIKDGQQGERKKWDLHTAVAKAEDLTWFKSTHSHTHAGSTSWLSSKWVNQPFYGGGTPEWTSIETLNVLPFSNWMFSILCRVK